MPAESVCVALCARIVEHLELRDYQGKKADDVAVSLLHGAIMSAAIRNEPLRPLGRLLAMVEVDGVARVREVLRDAGCPDHSYYHGKPARPLMA
jgi:hypothetical protein